MLSIGSELRGAEPNTVSNGVGNTATKLGSGRVSPVVVVAGCGSVAWQSWQWLQSDLEGGSV
jgi:hypothetical protein